MALLTLTPTSGSPASIQVDEIDIYRVTANGAGSTVVYSGLSAFLGDQMTVIVNESPASIDALSTALFTLTLGGQSVLVNAFNIFDVVPSGSGSKIMYKEFGVITYLIASESPSTVKNLVNTSLASLKVAQVGQTFTLVGPTAATATEVLSGILVADVAANNVGIAMPSFADLSAAGLKFGSSITLYVNTTAGANVAIITAGAGGSVNANNDPAFAVAPAINAMQVNGSSSAKFEIFANSAASYIISRVY